MTAEIKPNYDVKRQKLSEIIPLKAPFTVYIEPTRICNFKCFYCIHSERDDENGEFKKLGYDIKNMEFDDFLKIIEQLAEFPPKSIKRIVFSGLGEPLANPRLPEMIKTAVNSKIADRVEIITNGLLLNKNLTDKLIESKLTNINISIQGLNAEKYKKVCDKKINFEDFLDNLQYLYKNRKETKIYIKIIDAALENKEEEQKFYQIFTPMADRIYIEHLIQMQQQLDKIKDKVEKEKNFYGEELDLSRKVCSPAFYFLQIGCDLDVFPCPVPGLKKTLSMGSMKNKTLVEIWNGEKRKNFLKTMLKLQKDKIPECQGCICFNAIIDPAEDLDKDAAILLKKFE